MLVGRSKLSRRVSSTRLLGEVKTDGICADGYSVPTDMLNLTWAVGRKVGNLAFDFGAFLSGHSTINSAQLH